MNNIASKPPTKDSTSNPYIAGTCFSVSLHPLYSSLNLWIVDSGTSQHICSNVNAFLFLKTISHSSVTLPNNITIHVSLCGDVQLTNQLILTNVLFVPQFGINLLSVSGLTGSTSLIVTFFQNDFVIQNSNLKKMIGKGNKRHGLYILDVDHLISCLHLLWNFQHTIAASSALTNQVSASTWHHRLGHLSPRVFDLDIIKKQLGCTSSTDSPCYICPFAKQRRLPFISHNQLSSFPFDLIHCDIWGPYNEPSHSGHQFFLTIVDDCTRFTWVFLLKQKSDVNTVIPYFFDMVHTQFQCKIKCLRSDNAKELQLTEFLNAQKVLHQFSCVERPQQNLVVERKLQHLLNVARALYFQSESLLSSVFSQPLI